MARTRFFSSAPTRRAGPALCGLAIVAVILTAVACRPPGMVASPSFDARSTPEFPSLEGPTSYLTDVRAWPHPGFDRVVVELSGDQQPSWQVRYLDRPPVQIGSGDPVDVDGSAFIEVRITPASAFDRSGGEPISTYDGPQRVSMTGSGVVTEVVSTGEFEQTLTWVIGLRQAQPFAAVHYESPSRIVVDVLAPLG